MRALIASLDAALAAAPFLRSIAGSLARRTAVAASLGFFAAFDFLTSLRAPGLGRFCFFGLGGMIWFGRAAGAPGADGATSAIRCSAAAVEGFCGANSGDVAEAVVGFLPPRRDAEGAH